MNIRHILVTTDLSAASFDACAPIHEFARERGAELTLLHIVQELAVAPHGAPLAPPITPPDLQQQLADARTSLEKLLEACPWCADARVDVVAGDNIADAVKHYVAQHDVDLVALSTHGRTGFRHLVLGSVAEAILRHSEVPVLVFPRSKD